MEDDDKANDQAFDEDGFNDRKTDEYWDDNEEGEEGEEDEDYDYGEEEGLGEEMESARKQTKPLYDRYEGNNRGGFGNPPIKNQFKRGGKGGPGRKKGTTNLESAMRKAIGKKLDVNKDRETRKMSPVEIFAERTLEAVLGKTKSPRLLEFGQALFAKYGPHEVDPTARFDVEKLGEHECDIFIGILDLMTNEVSLPNRSDSSRSNDNDDLPGTYRVHRREDGHIAIAKIDSE